MSRLGPGARIACAAMTEAHGLTMAEDARLAELMVAMARRREPHALATVVETRGSTSAHPGDRALIDAAGTVLFGWVGGGCAEVVADVRLELGEQIAGRELPVALVEPAQDRLLGALNLAV